MVDYTSYASLAEANTRLAVDPVRSAAWALLSDPQKNVNLVAATNRLDLLNWAGEKAGGNSQENAFPRTGLTYSDGEAVTDSDVPHEVEVATILLAGSIALDASLANSGSSGSNIERVKAGSAEVEFFRPTTGKPIQDETVFALIKAFLSGAASSSVGAFASGTGDESAFSDDCKYGRTKGFA